jgi:hypothetical protein
VHEPEAHDFWRTVFAKEYGVRAQIAVNDALVMRVRQAARNALHDRPSFVVIETFPADFAHQAA